MRFGCLVLLFSLLWFASPAQDGDTPFGPEILDLIDNKNYVQAEKMIDSMAIKYHDEVGYGLLRAQLFYDRGDKADGMALITALLQKFPDNGYVAFTYGRLLTEEGEWAKADSMYAIALGFCKTDKTCLYVVRYLQAGVFICKNQYESAIPLLKENLRDFPWAYNSKFMLAFAYLSSGNLNLAKNYFKECQKMKYYMYVENALGYLYNLQQKHGKAIKILEKALNKNPDDAYILSNLGYAYGQIGKAHKAFDLMYRSMELMPSLNYNYRSLGLTYMKIGDVEKACRYFEKAIEFGFTAEYGNEVLELQQQHCK